MGQPFDFDEWESGDTVRVSDAPGYETFTAEYVDAVQNTAGEWFTFVVDDADEYFVFPEKYVTKEER